MAHSADISVARAVFASALLRTEPNIANIPRSEAPLLARNLLRTANICTAANVKLCKSYIIREILPSINRTAALAKYLVTLSKSFGPKDPDARVDVINSNDESEGLAKSINGEAQQPPEPHFKRLHVLYILHDVLVYIQSHGSDARSPLSRSNSDIMDQLYPCVTTLCELTACGGDETATRSSPFILDLVSYWTKQRVFSSDQLDQLRRRASAAADAEWDTMLSRLAADGNGPPNVNSFLLDDTSKWILPDRHGVINDPTAPWHELPAANGLFMKRTRGYPLQAKSFPQGGFRLRNGDREASPELRRDVTNLYNEVLRCFDKHIDADEVQDVDALGNIIWKDPDRPTRNYWGFTLDGIDRRKDLAQRFENEASGYDDVGRPPRVNDAVERARMLANEQGRGISMGTAGGWGGGGGGGRGRGGWRGGPRY